MDSVCDQIVMGCKILPQTFIALLRVVSVPDSKLQQ